jgi:F-type H+-transporting ATPase subunit epsilon
MAEELLGKFRCMVLATRAKLLDCKTHSITLPAHDGQIGVLRNHMPTLCKLGLGIMEVRDCTTDDDRNSGSVSFLIDGGFVRISNNVVAVLAYDVVAAADVDTAKAEKMLAEANKLSGDDAKALQQRQHDIKKAALLLQMAQMAASRKDNHGIPA